MIRLLRRKDIDTQAWDNCVAQSKMPLFYGLSAVYDSMCEEWAGLVLNNYEAVMPIAIRRKWGFLPYVYQPYFVQQGGVFVNNNYHQSIPYERFFLKFSWRFVRVHLHLNYSNSLHKLWGYKLESGMSYVLNLNRPYAAIWSEYTKDARKNIEVKAQKKDAVFKEHIPVSEVISLYKKAYGHLNRGITDEYYMRFSEMLTQLSPFATYFTVGVYKQGELMAAGLFVQGFGRIHYCLGAPSLAGKKQSATHLLVDYVIEKHSQSMQVFDFEGSSIPEVAAFYQKFTKDFETFLRVKRA